MGKEWDNYIKIRPYRCCIWMLDLELSVWAFMTQRGSCSSRVWLRGKCQVIRVVPFSLVLNTRLHPEQHTGAVSKSSFTATIAIASADLCLLHPRHKSRPNCVSEETWPPIQRTWASQSSLHTPAGVPLGVGLTLPQGQDIRRGRDLWPAERPGPMGAAIGTEHTCVSWPTRPRRQHVDILGELPFIPTPWWSSWLVLRGGQSLLRAALTTVVLLHRLRLTLEKTVFLSAFGRYIITTARWAVFILHTASCVYHHSPCVRVPPVNPVYREEDWAWRRRSGGGLGLIPRARGPPLLSARLLPQIHAWIS